MRTTVWVVPLLCICYYSGLHPICKYKKVLIFFLKFCEIFYEKEKTGLYGSVFPFSSIGMFPRYKSFRKMFRELYQKVP